MNDRTNPHEHTDIERALASLAERDRLEPDAGFEGRVAGAMREDQPSRVPGLRRKKSTAWIPFVTAACVGIMGYIVWMPMMNRPVTKGPTPIADARGPAAVGALDAELLFVSFDAMDTFVATGDEVGESLKYLELQLELDGYESGSWVDLGGAL